MSESFTQTSPRTIMGIGAYRDRDALLAALRAEFGVDMPTRPGFVRAGGVTLARLAPDRFLACAMPHVDLAGRLAGGVAACAAVTEQSDLWHIVQASGKRIQDILARVVPIDLAHFPVGAVALTQAGHLHVQIWHVGEGQYELAVSRSYSGDLDHALHHARGSAP